MMKARDIKGILRDKGNEKGIVYILETLAEQQFYMMKRLVELAQYFDKIVDAMGTTVEAVDRAKAEVQRIQKLMEDDDLPPNTGDLN